MPDKKYGVAPRGKKFIACPWIPGQNRHVWAGTHETQEEATKAAIAKIEELRRLPANLETVETFAKRWVRDFPRPKESTNDRYRKDAERFANHVGPAKKLHEVTVPEARTYAQAHRHDLGALRAMYSDARRDGLVLENPFSELGISKGPGRRRIVTVTAEELGEIAEIARRLHDDFGPTFRAVIIFGAYSGLRPGEIFGLNRHDIDFEAETINVQRQFHKRRITLPKSGHTREVFLTPLAAQALREMPRRLDGEHLFSGKESQRITQSALTGYWRPVRAAFEATLDPRRRQEFEQAGKGSLDFYSITRHFCATFLVEEDVPAWIVARQLGHEDGGRLVEKTYSHPTDRVAREKLRRVFDKPTPLRAVEAQEATG